MLNLVQNSGGKYCRLVRNNTVSTKHSYSNSAGATSPLKVEISVENRTVNSLADYGIRSCYHLVLSRRLPGKVEDDKGEESHL